MKQDKGNPEEILNKLFGSISRTRILCFLFGFFGQSFYQREIMFQTGISLQAIQRELSNLVEIGIISKDEADNRVYYKVNTDSGFFKPLEEFAGFLGAPFLALDRAMPLLPPQ